MSPTNESGHIIVRLEKAVAIAGDRIPCAALQIEHIESPQMAGTGGPPHHTSCTLYFATIIELEKFKSQVMHLIWPR